MRNYSAEQIGLKYYLSRKNEFEQEVLRSKMLAHNLMGTPEGAAE